MSFARRQSAAPPALENAHLPAPIGGLNTVAAGGLMPELDAMLLYNMVQAENGLRSRLGSREWCTGLTGAADNTVRTILTFKGSASSGSKNRVFACTSSGIWNVTNSGGVTGAYAGLTAFSVGAFVTYGSSVFACKTAGTSAAGGVLPDVWSASTGYVVGNRVINAGNVYICVEFGTSDLSGGPTGTGAGIADGTVLWDYQSADTDIVDGTVVWNYQPSNVAPTLALAFAATSGDAGFGVAHAAVTSAGHFLLYCDEVNGLHIYTESTDTWAAVAMGVGAAQISGVDPATFRFVTVFKSRVCFAAADSQNMYYLAAGAVYGAATAFALSGQFRSGGHLVGLWNWTYDGGGGIDDALVAISAGGDVVIYQGTDPKDAATFGVKGTWSAGGIPVGRDVCNDFGGDLLILTRVGVLPLSKLVLGVNVEEQSLYATSKIANLFNQAMLSKSSIRGWSIRLNPEDNTLLVTVPDSASTNTTQLAMAVTGKSWSRYRDLPIYSAEVFDGKLYYGTSDGKVGIHDGYVDGVTLADPNAYTAIQYAGLTAFRNLGNGQQKQVQMLRPTLLADGPSPAFSCQAKYRYDLAELATVSPSVPGSGAWGTGLWDTAIWGGEYTASQVLTGASGMGVDVAIAWRGAATSRTVLVGWDVAFTQGGFL